MNAWIGEWMDEWMNDYTNETGGNKIIPHSGFWNIWGYFSISR